MSRPTPLAPSPASILTRLVETRGAASRHSTLDEAFVQVCADAIDLSGVLPEIDRWRQIDRSPTASNGGRPACLDFRALLTMMLALQRLGEPPLLTHISAALRHRLTDASRTLLQLRPDVNDISEEAHYHRVVRCMRRLTDLFEPNPGVAGRRRTADEHAVRMQQIDPEQREERQKRAVWISNTLLHATYKLLPEGITSNWDGTVAIDGTKFHVWGKRGTAKHADRDADGTVSPEPSAGWYHRDGNHGGLDDDNKTALRGRRAVKTHWAMEAHLAIMSGKSRGRLAFPRLCIGVSLDAPSGRPGENAQTVLRSLHERGMPAGTLVADRAYLPGAREEVLMKPARALGYGLAMDYRRDQLGAIRRINGAILVEGTWYCPSMPQRLIDATISYLDDKDDDAYRKLLQQRTQYELQPKERRNDKGSYRLRCPAVGKFATTSCPLRPPQPGKVHLGMPRTLTVIPAQFVPSDPGSVCTNADSVTFSADDGAKYVQEHPYQSRDWAGVYRSGRSSIESFNAYVKSNAHEDLENAGRRRVRGYAKQLLVITMGLLSANIRKIERFSESHDTEDRRRIAAVSGSPASTDPADLRTFRPSVNAPPLVVPGVA